MDVATRLVQAYLRVNGFFTATDYPIVETGGAYGPRTMTDVDVLAVRFGPSASANPSGGKTHRVTGPVTPQPDPELGVPPHGTDMIVAEVKQGLAQVNPASRDRKVLAAALARFGCCEPKESLPLTRALFQTGRAQGLAGHAIRMVLFASRGDRAPRGWHWVRLERVFLFLDDYLRTGEHVLHGVDLHDPVLAWLALQRKCGLALTPEKPTK